MKSMANIAEDSKIYFGMNQTDYDDAILLALLLVKFFSYFFGEIL